MMVVADERGIVLNLKDEQESEKCAARLAFSLCWPLVITWSGDIGVGKTTLIRAMLRALGVQSAIKSPTFSLVESYSCPLFEVHHFDLYRIHQEDELEYIGFRDYFSNQSICCIEWAEHAGYLLPEVDIRCALKMEGAGRRLEMVACTAAGKKILACFLGE